MRLASKIIRRVWSFAVPNWKRCLMLRLGGVKIGKGTYIAWGSRIGDKVIIGKSVRINKDCIIGNNVEIGDYTQIGKGTSVGPNVLIGKNVRIGRNTHIANSIIGDHSFIESGVFFTGFQEGKIKIGKNSYIGIYSVLDWSGDIEIGNCVHIAGPSVGIWTHTSVFQALSGDKLSDNRKKQVTRVKIEDYVYIGGNSTIYPGVKIKSHSVVLPNTAVNKDVDAYLMVGGSPASPKRKIEITDEKIKFIKLRTTN